MSIPETLAQREVSGMRVCALPWRDCSMRRMALQTELHAHEGCVNHVSFNANDDMLVSGSDDRHICVWDVRRQKLVLKHSTGHSQNIFCAKFMPCSDGGEVATCSGDGEVRLHRLDVPCCADVWRHHTERVKKIAVPSDTPHIILSASEDGTVQHIDRRAKRVNKIIDVGRTPSMLECNAIALARARPSLLALAASDDVLRLFDMRCVRSTADTSCKAQVVQEWQPSRLDAAAAADCISGVALSDDGSTIAANYLGDYVYLFAVDLPSVMTQCSMQRQAPHAVQHAAQHGTDQPQHGDDGNGATAQHDGGNDAARRNPSDLVDDIIAQRGKGIVPRRQRYGLASELVNLAETMLQQRSHRVAGRHALAATLLCPRFGYAHYIVARCCDALNMRQEALQATRRALMNAWSIDLQRMHDRLQRQLESLSSPPRRARSNATMSTIASPVPHASPVQHMATQFESTALEPSPDDEASAIPPLSATSTESMAAGMAAGLAADLAASVVAASASAADPVRVEQGRLLHGAHAEPCCEVNSNAHHDGATLLPASDTVPCCAEDGSVAQRSGQADARTAESTILTPTPSNPSCSHSMPHDGAAQTMAHGTAHVAQAQTDAGAAILTASPGDHHASSSNHHSSDHNGSHSSDHDGSHSSRHNGDEDGDSYSNSSDDDDDDDDDTTSSSEEWNDDFGMRRVMLDWPGSTAHSAGQHDNDTHSDDEQGAAAQSRRVFVELGRLLCRGEPPPKHGTESQKWLRRLRGHVHARTIKDVAFIGASQRYVAAGSDDGCLFIWRRDSGDVVEVLAADAHVVNGVACHAQRLMLASCGIDRSVKLWTPCLPQPRQHGDEWYQNIALNELQRRAVCPTYAPSVPSSVFSITNAQHVLQSMRSSC